MKDMRIEYLHLSLHAAYKEADIEPKGNYIPHEDAFDHSRYLGKFIDVLEEMEGGES